MKLQYPHFIRLPIGTSYPSIDGKKLYHIVKQNADIIKSFDWSRTIRSKREFIISFIDKNGKLWTVTSQDDSSRIVKKRGPKTYFQLKRKIANET